jgi:hypothetical protein
MALDNWEGFTPFCSTMLRSNSFVASIMLWAVFASTVVAPRIPLQAMGLLQTKTSVEPLLHAHQGFFNLVGYFLEDLPGIKQRPDAQA